VIRKEKTRNACRNVVRKQPLGIPRMLYGDNIRMCHRKVGCEIGKWVTMAQDRVQWRTSVLEVLNFKEF